MKKILITGAGGYFGYQLARRYLEQSEAHLLLWMRGGERAAARRAFWEERLAPYRARLSFAFGDLGDERPFEGIDPNEVRAILHPAANTRFDIDEATARRVNIAGTRRLLELARRCPALESFALISTIYSSGLRPGPIAERPLDDGFGFANHYERSKWESERALVEDFGDLPWRIFRAATVISDDDSGAVSQFNVFHKILRLMYAGLLPIFPGLAGLPIYLVTGDFVAEAIFALMGRAAPQTVYNLCPTDAEAPRLGGWLDRSYDLFLRDEHFRGRRLLRPMFTDLKSFQLLAASVNAFSRDVVLRAVVELVSPFAEQMFVEKAVSNAQLRAVYPEYRAPDFPALLDRICARLVASGWGERALSGVSARIGVRWEV